MTPDDLKKQLAELGIDTGKWAKTLETTTEINLVQDQKKQLLVIRNILQALAKKDRALSLQLQERVNRLKYGGGS